MRIYLHLKYPLFLSDFNETRIFSTGFKKFSYIKFHENIRPARAELLHENGQMDRRTDRHDEATIRFLQFCKPI